MSKGRLIIREIKFSQLLERRVIKNNRSSGKVTLPKHLIGKKVYIVIEGKGGQDGRD